MRVGHPAIHSAPQVSNRDLPVCRTLRGFDPGVADGSDMDGVCAIPTTDNIVSKGEINNRWTSRTQKGKGD